jgi:hypothetical protein
VAAAVIGLVPGTGRPEPLTKEINAGRFGGITIVGALFAGGTSQPHFCTAGVVSSPAPDLSITAAHCLPGSGEGLDFVPDYRAGQTPYWLWNVTAACAPGRHQRSAMADQWTTRRDPGRRHQRR